MVSQGPPPATLRHHGRLVPTHDLVRRGSVGVLRAPEPRTRAHTKAQYLRIQAWHLQETGEHACVRAALELLDRMLADFPEIGQLAHAHGQRAECLDALGHREHALDAYRDSLEAQRKLPSVRTDAYLGFVELILALGREELYGEVTTVLNEFGTNEVFPRQRYRSFAVRALVSERLGDLEEARRYAELALEAAAATESPFRNHRRVGLVGDPDPGFEARLLSLARRAH